MQGGDAGGARSAAPARGLGAQVGVDVSVGWLPTWTYDGFGGGGNERPSSLWGPTLAWTPVATWSIWALFFEAAAHGAEERQAADEPMSRPTLVPGRGNSGPVSVSVWGRVLFPYPAFRGPHRYEILSSPICHSTKCTLKDVTDALNRVGVHPGQKRTFVPGRRYEGDVGIPWPGPDLISTEATYEIHNGNKRQVGIRNRTVYGKTRPRSGGGRADRVDRRCGVLPHLYDRRGIWEIRLAECSVVGIRDSDHSRRLGAR